MTIISRGKENIVALKGICRCALMTALLCASGSAGRAAGEDPQAKPVSPPAQDPFPNRARHVVKSPQPARLWDVRCTGDIDRRIDLSWRRLHRAPYDAILLDFRKDRWAGYETPGRAQFALSLIGQYRHEVSSLLEKSFAERPKFLNKDGVLATLKYDTSKGFKEHEVWGQSWHIRGSIAYAELTGDTLGDEGRRRDRRPSLPAQHADRLSGGQAGRRLAALGGPGLRFCRLSRPDGTVREDREASST